MQNEDLIEIQFPDETQQAVTGYTPDNVNTIAKQLHLGMTIEDCAHLLKLPKARLNQWYRDDFHGFRGLVDRAVTLNKQVHVSRLFAARDNNELSASKWWLERKHKEEFTKETVVKFHHATVDTLAKVVFESAMNYIKDPDQLKLFVQDLQLKLQQVKPQIEDAKFEVLENGN